MCRQLVLALLLGLFMLALALVCLPWRANLVLLVLAAVLAKPVGRWLLQRAFLAPFRLKGAVLRQAQVEVHSVTPAARPAQATDDADLAWYRLEATIRPAATAQTPFALWEPSELMLCRPDVKGTYLGEDGHVGTVHEARVLGAAAAPRSGSAGGDGGALVPEDAGDASGKVAGPQRLSLLVAVDPAVQVARFRYYLEVFGEVRLPGMIEAG